MTSFKVLYSVFFLEHFKQCCGAGAGGAEIILVPGAGAEIMAKVGAGAENK